MLVLLLAACGATTAPATPMPRVIPSPTTVGTPGNGGVCADPVPDGFTCVTGVTQLPSGALAGGVCVNVGPVANCPLYTDTQGTWRTMLPNGVRFILTFSVNGTEKAKVDLTPSFLSGGKKEWVTPIVIEP